MATKKKKSVVDSSVRNAALLSDGCNPELVKGAEFDGIFEIPILSSINPFFFKEITSAVPSYYAEFEQIIGNKEITIDNSFELAKKYINSINVPSVVESFNTLKEDQWADACKAYLSTPHKGQDI